ncbi:hypothetical protein CsSME_00036374 [Camellia sinensis var. sinensis]
MKQPTCPAAIEALQANYHNPNEAVIRIVLWYRNRDCHEFLGYVSTYRYSAPRRSRVTNFLRAPSPPPDPTLPDVPLIRLTEEEEMAKRSRIKNLITATSTELPSIPSRAAAAGQTNGAVVALASTAAVQPSKDSCRAGKRPRTADPSAELVAELSTKQPAAITEPTPPWKPQLKHRGKQISASASVKGDKEHLLAFDLTKALLLLSDVTGSDHVLDTRLVKSSVKSMTRVRILHVLFKIFQVFAWFPFSNQTLFLQAIQKQHLVMERIHRLRQKVTDAASQVKHLQTELGQLKASLEIANTDNSKLLSQLRATKKEKDALRAELEALKQSRKDEVDEANNACFKEAEESYTKQVEATKDIFFKSGWKAACEQLGQGSGTDVFASPPATFLPTYMVPYANDVFSALQAEAEEESGDEAKENAERENHPKQASQVETGVQETTTTVDLEAVATGNDFADLSPLV